MNSSQDNPVLLNLRDSVSRIVYNLGFSSIDSTAHAKLVDVMVTKLYELSGTCRFLAENAGTNAAGLNTPTHFKYLFQLNNVNLEELVDYVKQVRPFPPRKSEIHGEGKFPKNPANAEEAPKEPPQRLRSAKKSKLPVFDDMDDVDLGYNFVLDPPEKPPSPAPPTPTVLTPPPPPPPLPPLLPFEIPVFDPEVPPPPLPNLFMPGTSSLSFEDVPFAPFVPSFTSLEDPAPEKPKTSSSKRSSESSTFKPFPMEKTSSSAFLKMTKKKRMHAKYERRLRDEQVAKEEKKRERRVEKKRLEAEKARRSAERAQEKPQRITFRFDPAKIALMNKFKESRSGSDNFDENDNRMKLKISSASTSSIGPDSRQPLPKINIKYKKQQGGSMLIKKVVNTDYQWKNGSWKPIETKWKCNRGVISYPQSARKASRATDAPIPKLKVVKNADGEYQIKE